MFNTSVVSTFYLPLFTPVFISCFTIKFVWKSTSTISIPEVCSVWQYPLFGNNSVHSFSLTRQTNRVSETLCSVRKMRWAKRINQAIVTSWASSMYLPSCFQVQTFSTEPSQFVGRNSSVGIAIRYGLGGPGIESLWGGEIFRTCPDRLWGPRSLLYNGYRVSLPGVKRPGRGVDHPPRLKKEYSHTSAPPLGLRGLFYGELYLYIYPVPLEVAGPVTVVKF